MLKRKGDSFGNILATSPSTGLASHAFRTYFLFYVIYPPTSWHFVLRGQWSFRYAPSSSDVTLEWVFWDMDLPNVLTWQLLRNRSRTACCINMHDSWPERPVLWNLRHPREGAANWSSASGREKWLMWSGEYRPTRSKWKCSTDSGEPEWLHWQIRGKCSVGRAGISLLIE